MNETLADSLTPESIIIVKNAIAKNINDFIAHPEMLNYYITELQQPCKNGQIIWVEVSTQIRYSPQGDIEVVGVSRNIEEWKKSEIALHESNRMLRDTQAVAHIGAYITNLNASEFDTNTWQASPEMYKIFGIDKTYPHTLAGWVGFIHPDSREELFAYHYQVVVDRKRFDLEYKIIRINDGVERWVQRTGELEYDDQGEPVRMLGTIQDITARKQFEQDLITAKEHAEESDRLKSAFLANMSHEIRTPMNGILGFASLLKETNLTGEEQQEYIRIIEKSGKRMLNIINDIVDISKIESGQMDISISESNINEQIEFIYNFFKPEAERKIIQLSFKNTLPSIESIIKTDHEKIYAILTNLVKNAIKYTNEGSIEFGYILKTVSEPVELEFFVKDTGIGISKDRQEAVFERFIQADIFDKQAFEGAGLGLSIAKAYVEMLGGKIWVKSEIEEGSTFYFTIPYNVKKHSKRAIPNVVSPADEVSQIKILKILIAEDEETSDFLITRMFKKISREVLHAKTGIEAVDACRNNPDIDLVLMDIRMPVMGGYEATRQIRGFNKDLIIIAQTAYGLSGDRQKSIDAGCNDYLSKPINQDELLGLIQKHFKK